jgi:tyrosyl-tRNA synthetase
MNTERRFKLITNGSVELAEILTEEELLNLLETNDHPTSYFGIATSGPLHIGYLKPINKQLDLIKAGFNHKVLIADIHAYLDDMKCPWELLEARAKYYKKSLEISGLSPNKVEYIKGSNFQMSKKYTSKLFRAVSMVTFNRALRAASETCRITENPHVSELLYPIMQIIDQIFLEVDLSYGGLDQRHVYALGRELLPKMGYKPPVAIFTERSPGLKKGTSMSASQPETTIQLHDSEKEIEEKIMKAYCPPRMIENNPVIEILRYFVMPRYKKLAIQRPQKFGGDIILKSYNDLKEQYVSGKLHPTDLKLNTIKYLKEILKPATEYFEKHPEILKEALPKDY